MQLNLLDIILLVSLTQGIIFGIAVLFGRLFNDLTIKYLGISVILISIIGIERWLNMWGFTVEYYFLDFFGDDVPWILLYFVPIVIYFLKSVDHRLANSRKLWFLTIPFVVFLFLNIIIDLDIDFGWIKAPFFVHNMYLIYDIEVYLAFAFSLALCSFSYFIIHKSKKTSNIKWLKRVWLFTFLLHFVWLSLVFTQETFFNTNKSIGYQLWIGVSFFIYFLIYRGMYQLNLVQNRAAIKELLERKNIPDSNAEKKKSITVNPMKNASEDEYISMLKWLMEKEHFYRNPDLDMETVANKIGISLSYLSLQIKLLLKTNYISFVNSYRINDVKSMLLDPEFKHYSILSIGLEAGFKSKSAFYSFFKKETGVTPIQFKNRMNKS